MKRIIASIGLVLIAAVLFAAAQGEVASAPQMKQIKVVFKENGKGSMTNWMKDLEAAFEKGRPDVDVELVPVLGSDQDYVSKSSLMLKSDSSVDVMAIDGFLLSSYVSPGYIAELPVSTWPDWATQFTDAIKKGVTVGGKVYAAPYSTDTRGLYYNIEAFKKAGIPVPWEPKSWSDVLAAVRKLKGVVEYPIWMPGSIAQGEGAAMNTLEMWLSGTPDWIFENGKWVASSKGMLDTLSLIHEFYVKEGAVESKKLALMLDPNNRPSLVEKLMKGETGILIDGNSKGRDWEKDPEHKAKIGVTPMPKQSGGGFTSMSGGWTIAVPNLSKQKTLGFEFIKVAASYDGILGNSKHSGDMAVRKDVIAAAAYREVGYYRAIMSDYVAFTNFRPAEEAYPQISQQLAAAVEAVMTGAKSPADALKEYSVNVKKIVGAGNWIEK